MSEFPKFIPKEDIVGTVEFRKMEPDVEYEVVDYPFRNRVVTLTPAPELAPVKVDFFPDEDGERVADIRELTRWGTGLTEHDLAAFLINHGIVPFVSHDLLRPISIPKPPPPEIDQPDPTDPRSHIEDYEKEKGPTK